MSVNNHSADIPEEMSVKNIHITCQPAALYKSFATDIGFSKKCEMGMPMNIGSHVGVAAKAIGMLSAVQDTSHFAVQEVCSLSGEAFLYTDA
jgi:hypothetical protein